jgi:hypothetical protein
VLNEQDYCQSNERHSVPQRRGSSGVLQFFATVFAPTRFSGSLFKKNSFKMFQLREQLDEKVLRFINYKGARTKKEAGDLGEFIINMFVSRLKEALITEFFTRQIYWIEKNLGIALERLTSNRDNFLEKAFRGAKTSNLLLVFNIEMAKFFITDNQTKMAILDKRLGILPDHVVKSFQDRIVEIKKKSPTIEFY